MAYYERNLPHWHPPGASIFLTCRLYGSLPLKSAGNARIVETNLSPGRKFQALDAMLDRASAGPTWLRDPKLAECIAAIIEHGAMPLAHYKLHAFVVMANHVHALLTPLRPIRQLAKGLKGASARACNDILGRTGVPFWQDESFDHWVRSSSEFDRIRSYIERNPVVAGLVSKPTDWPYSSATRQRCVTAV